MFSKTLRQFKLFLAKHPSYPLKRVPSPLRSQKPLDQAKRGEELSPEGYKQFKETLKEAEKQKDTFSAY